MSSTNDELSARLDQNALIITIDHQAKRNALSSRVLSAFADLQHTWRTRGDVRALILTGAGDRAFCSGADLQERRHMNSSEVKNQLRRYQSDLGWLCRCEVPVVAAINGVALGGGLELALMCDLRICAPDVTLGLPETMLAVIPGAGGTQRLPRLIGEARAKELILLGTRVDAATALAFGLVNRVSASRESLLEETLDWLGPVLMGASVAQQAALNACRRAQTLPLPRGLALERTLYEQCLETEDRAEALLAFAEKRAPVFKGR